MELGVNLGYFGMGVDQDNVAVAQEADRLGYAVAWAAEAYGSDVPTVLSWIGALTERIDLGAAVMQIPARTPAMTAMTAAPRSIRSVSAPIHESTVGTSEPYASAAHATAYPRRSASRATATLSWSTPMPK